MTAAIVLLSGGMDSAVCLADTLHGGFDPVFTLGFRYGQRHWHELHSASLLADHYGVDHRVVEIDLGQFGGSALTDTSIDLPRDRTSSEMGGGVAATYVPARNTIFLSYALAYAEVRGASRVIIGANALDFEGYPDCRPAYYEAFNELASQAVPDRQVRVNTPLIHRSKLDILCLGEDLGVPWEKTSSCYDPNMYGACGRCDACVLRLEAFRLYGITDPIPYRDWN